jgi:outer membrane lipoprotein-sorting protein
MMHALLAMIPGLMVFGLNPTVQPDIEQPETTPTVDDSLIAELSEIDARGEQINDLTADFEQRKFTAILKKPLVSEGKVRMAGPRTRWDTERPRKSVLLLDEKELKLYDPEAATLEVYDLTGALSRMTASPVPRLAAVRDEFAIERLEVREMDEAAAPSSHIAVRLTPLQEGTKEHVTEVRVLIDRALACATQVEVTDPDRDRTVIRFRNLRTNTGLNPADLDLRVPAGTTTSRPLQGAGGAPR